MFCSRHCRPYVLIYYIMIIMPLETHASVSQSYLTLSNSGYEFAPFDQNALLLYETNTDSISSCSLQCHMSAECRIFNFDHQTKYCRLYEGDINTTGEIVLSLSSQSIYGLIDLTMEDFVDYGRSCASCEGSRLLRCMNSTCQCQSHTYFDGSICRSQKLQNGGCSDDKECRNDLNLTCQSNMQCDYNFIFNITTVSTTTTSTSTSTSTTDTSSTTTTSTSTTTTTTSRSLSIASCLNQTWTSSANRLAYWLFDGNYRDQMINHNATPTNTMPFISNGYVNQALEFVVNTNPKLNVPYIPLSSTSFTVDTWLYITGLGSTYDHGIFGYCSEIAFYKCLHLTIRRNNGNYHLYFGFFGADCEGTTSLTLNTWIHAAFVFDLITLTQRVYFNGVLENTCTQSSALTLPPTGVTIGFIPTMDINNFTAYYQGYMDQMSVSNRAKSPCEILEIATLVAHFTFDTASFLIDSGPNSLQATTQSTSSTSSGRYSQGITFDGSNSSYYQMSSFTSLGTSNQPFSLSLWLRPANLSGTVLHSSNEADGTDWCLPYIGFSLNGSLQAQIYNGIGAVSIGDPNNTVSTLFWSHVVQTWSSTNGLRLYVNSILVASRSSPISLVNRSPFYVTLGNTLNGITHCAFGTVTSSPYRGDMDDFRVYTSELSADDIYILFTN